MKKSAFSKILTTALILCMIFTLSLNVAAGAKVDGDKETIAYSGTVTIDGKIDDIWNSVPEVKVDIVKENASLYFGDASKVAGKDFAALTVKALWDSAKQELYLLYNVVDKKISLVGANDWLKDSIELFIDEDNVRDVARDENGRQLRIYAEAGNLTDSVYFNAERAISADGYIVEMAYSFVDINQKAGDWVGIDFQVNDDALGDGERHVCLGWSDATDKASADATVWGQMLLSDIKIADAAASNFAYTSQKELDDANAAAAAARAAAAETPAPAPDTAAAETPAPVSPKTGDSAVVISVLCAVLALAMGTVLIRRRKTI